MSYGDPAIHRRRPVRAVVAVVVAALLILTLAACEDFYDFDGFPITPGSAKSEHCDAVGNCTVDFAFGSDIEDWVVPEGATQISFEVVGGSGQSAFSEGLQDALPHAGGLGGAFETAPVDFPAGRQFKLFVGGGGLTMFGGIGGGGRSSDPAVAQEGGSGGGGGTYISFLDTDGIWKAFAIAGGGSGATALEPGFDGGGANEPGKAGTAAGNGGGGTLSAGGAAGYKSISGRECYGSSGTGPARYDVQEQVLYPGQGGDGSHYVSGIGGPLPGSGGGGGYFGGGGGVDACGAFPLTSHAGGGGSGYLAPGYQSTPLPKAPLSFYESRDGRVRITYRLVSTGDLVAHLAAPASLTAGEGTVLSATAECAIGSPGELVFTRGGVELGRAGIDPSNGFAELTAAPSKLGSDAVEVRYLGAPGVCAGLVRTIALSVHAQFGASPRPDGCDEAGECRLQFDYTGAVEKWVVPTGARDIQFEVRAGSGAGNIHPGGLGGYTKTVPLAIDGGVEFALAVGQGGQGGRGGWGGGGDGDVTSDQMTASRGGGGGTYLAQYIEDEWRFKLALGGGSGAATMRGGFEGIGSRVEPILHGGGLNGGLARWNGPGDGGTSSTAGSFAGRDGGAAHARTDGETLTPGQAGNGGVGPAASGSGGGGGYFGGGGGAVIGSNGYAGGGGGIGFLDASIFPKNYSLPQPPLKPFESRDGQIVITFTLDADETSLTAAAAASASVATPVTLAATLGCRYGISGTVDFSIGGRSIGAGDIDPATGEASISYTPQTPGQERVDVNFPGLGNICDAASTSIQLEVGPAASEITTAQADPVSLEVGESTRLSATVECVAGPRGSLRFTRDSAEIGRAAVNPSTGTAVLGYSPTEASDAPVSIEFVSADGRCAGASGQAALTVTPSDEDPPPIDPGASELPEGCDETGVCQIEVPYSGAGKEWVVPAGAEDVSFTVVGGSGQGEAYAGGIGGAFITDPADIEPGTRFMLFTGQSGQGGSGGFGGGGAAGGSPSGWVEYQGQGGGGGSFVFAEEDDSWAPFAVAGGGSGAAASGTGFAGGGANEDGAGGSDFNGAGGSVTAPGTGGAMGGPETLPGDEPGSGAGAASYSPGNGLVPGAGGVGGTSRATSFGSGSGAGGGYQGGGGGGVAASPAEGAGGRGGGGSGYLAGGYTATPLAQEGLQPGESRNGRIGIAFHLKSSPSVITLNVDPTHPVVGTPGEVTVSIHCDYAIEGGTVALTLQQSPLGDFDVVGAPPQVTSSILLGDSGPHTLAASYSGWGEICKPAVSDLTFEGEAAPTSLTAGLTDGGIAAAERPIPIQAAVSSVNPVLGVPEGDVQFFIGQEPVGDPAPLDAHGVAIGELPVQAAGPLELRAVYTPAGAGAGVWAGVEGSFPLTVSTVAEATASIELSASERSVKQGGTITLSTEAFDANGDSLGDVGGAAVYTSSVNTDVIEGARVTFPHASPHRITAVFAGQVSHVDVEVIPAENPALSTTGAQGVLWMGAAGLLVLVLGGALYLVQRRRDRDRGR